MNGGFVAEDSGATSMANCLHSFSFHCPSPPSLLHSRFKCRHAMLLPLRDDTKNGCVADYHLPSRFLTHP